MVSLSYFQLELVGPKLNNLGSLLYNNNRWDIQALRETLMGPNGVLARLTRLEGLVKLSNLVSIKTISFSICSYAFI